MTSLAVLPVRSADRSRRALGICLLLAVGFLCLAPSPAIADSEPVAACSGGPLNQTVIGGSPLYVVAQAPTPIPFGATFDGVARTGVTAYFTPTFPTPVVDAPTQLRLVVTCSGAAGTVASEYPIIVLPRTGSTTGIQADGTALASARTRPPIVLKLVLFSIPAILGLASVLIFRRKSTSR